MITTNQKQMLRERYMGKIAKRFSQPNRRVYEHKGEVVINNQTIADVPYTIINGQKCISPETYDVLKLFENKKTTAN